MTCQTFVTNNAVLTIEEGTTIFATPQASNSADSKYDTAPALVITRGAKIMARGTAAKPITMTAVNPDTSSTSLFARDTTTTTTTLQTRGKWGGLVILGNAPHSLATTTVVEGITGSGTQGHYGGTDANDNSGVLSYVRVWHGGAHVSANNELNGVTFGGVGAGTTVDHCEVAFNADDGFEFFGGTVNVKYLSVLFVGDDAFDTDHGYQGKGQFLFAMEGPTGDHGWEMDSSSSPSSPDTAPRSHPQFYSMTIIGGGTSSAAGTGELMHINDGTGGSFGNMVLSHASGNGLNFEDCSASVTYSNAATRPAGAPDLFWWSPNNIINGIPGGSSNFAGCSQASFGSWSSIASSPGFQSVATADIDYETMSSTFNPLPAANGAMCTGTVDDPTADSFFDAVACKGAFASSTDNWLEGWSWLDCAGKMASTGTDQCTSLLPRSFNTLKSSVSQIGGSYTSSLSLSADTTYLLDSQLFMASGTTLTIPQNTTILALPVASASAAAPAIVIERGATINAAGIATAPITLTSIFAEAALQSSAVVTTDSASASGSIALGARGKWGGLILLGNAPTSAATPKNIEGISGYTYGGSDPADSSGTLQYVRVWHGGAAIAADNEINGITFGGVGSGTTVEYCEVAYNADDGFEFFGGTVNVKYLSVLFVGDDAFDTDEGYQGMGQFLFAMLGTAGNHGTEMDSKTGSDSNGNPNFNSMPRSHPAFYSMTIIAGGASSDGPSDAVMRLREGTGGKFGNLILSNLGGTHKGIEIKDCGSESIVQTMPSASVSIGVSSDPASAGYLYVSPAVAIGSPAANSAITIASGCSATPSSFSFTDVELLPSSGSITETGGDTVDPRPACSSGAYSGVDAVPGSSFFTAVGFKGAFGNQIWLDGWSYLDQAATGSRIPSSNNGCGSAGDITGPSPPASVETADTVALCGDITTDTVLVRLAHCKYLPTL